MQDTSTPDDPARYPHHDTGPVTIRDLDRVKARRASEDAWEARFTPPDDDEDDDDRRR